MLLEFSMKNCSIACTPSIVVVSSWVLSSPSSKISLHVLFSYDATNSHLYFGLIGHVYCVIPQFWHFTVGKAALNSPKPRLQRLQLFCLEHFTPSSSNLMVLLIFGISLVLIAPISLIRLILESGVVVSTFSPSNSLTSIFFIRYDWPKFSFWISSDQKVHFTDVVHQLLHIHSSEGSQFWFADPLPLLAQTALSLWKSVTKKLMVNICCLLTFNNE